MLLAYINQAAALYHIPSLGQQVDIMITYLGNIFLSNYHLMSACHDTLFRDPEVSEVRESRR